MKRNHLSFGMAALLLFAVLISAPAQADDAVGWVSVASGSASVTSPDQDARAAEVKMSVLAEDMLTTGADSTMQVVMRDETILALGADSSLLVLDTLTPEAEGMFHVRLAQGAARILSSSVARANPDRFKLESPLGSVGIRGTEFGIRVLPERSTVLLYEGGPVIFASTDGGGASNQEACTKLGKALRDAEKAYKSAKEKMKSTIKSKMKRRINEIQELQAQAGCTP